MREVPDLVDCDLRHCNSNQSVVRTPDGQYSRWQNPNNGHYGYSVPERTYQDSQGQYCREYQTTVVIDNRPQSGHGTACREPDGTWRLVS